MEGPSVAAAPAGELRFRAPQPPARCTEVADATAFGPACPQPVFPNMPVDLGAPQGEDCLRLNIWASSDTQAGDAKPVMVWLHGGAYVLGSSSQTLYDGRRLVSHGDVVVVTVNYRLGVLGFLDLSSFRHRRHFDSQRRVARRAGGAAVGARQHRCFRWRSGAGHAVRRVRGGRDGHHAAGQPGGRGSVRRRDRAKLTGHFGVRPRQCGPSGPAFLDRLGIAPSESRRLVDIPIAAIVAASQQVFDEVPVRNPGRLAFVPIVDGDVLSDYPVKLAQEGRSHPVPLIIGTNKHEAALFRLMRSRLMPITPSAITSMFNQIAAEQPDLQLPTEDGDRFGVYAKATQGEESEHRDRRRLPDAVGVARRGTRTGGAGVLYRFDYATPLLRLVMVGAAHATELPYVWGNLGGPKDPSLKLGGVKAAKAVSKRVRTRWINFAAGATPAGPAGEPEWTSYARG